MRSYLRGEEGVTLVEFALSIPILTLAMVGIMEVSMVLFVSSMMEGGVREAARFGITGGAPDGQTREERIIEIVSDRTLGLLKLSEEDISMLIYPSFDSVGKPEPFTDNSPENDVYDEGEDFLDVNGNGVWDADMGAAGLGGPGDIVLYRIDAQWELMTGLLNSMLGEDGKVSLTASIVVRNEPFGEP
ncbi:MAG: TadE/TadG family type IV pilus assembly protein [Rhodovibrionaceae bacterium]